MRYTIRAGAGFSVVSVATEVAQEALERARDLVEQGMSDVTITDGDGEVRTPDEFAQLIGDGTTAELGPPA